VNFISLFKMIPIFSNTTSYSGNSFPTYKIKRESCLSFSCRCNCNFSFCKRQDSLISLLIRLRSVAFLKFLLLTPTATCNLASLFSGSQITLNGKLEKLLPLLKSSSIDFLLFSLSAFLKKYRGVVDK